jgi:hypothetical protein
VRGLAERVKCLLSSDSEIVYADGKEIHGPAYEEAESFEKVPVLKAALELGWKPEVGLDELILETAAYYRTREDYRQEREGSSSVYALSESLEELEQPGRNTPAVMLPADG